MPHPSSRIDRQALTRLSMLVHSFGLSVGLKGNTTEAPELWQYFDWTLDEQCWEYDECEFLRDSFLASGKAVLNIEYDVNPDCARANAWHMNSARRDLNLVGPTHPAHRYAPCIPNSQPVWPDTALNKAAFVPLVRRR